MGVVIAIAIAVDIAIVAVIVHGIGRNIRVLFTSRCARVLH